MTKSEIFSKLALIQKEIEHLELLQKEVESFYFEQTILNGKIQTTDFNSAMSYFTLTLDTNQTKLFVDNILTIKKDEYTKLFREITDVE